MNLSPKASRFFVIVLSVIFISINIYGVLSCRHKSPLMILVTLRDNFPGKEYFLEKYNSFKIYNLHENPMPDRVIIGKDGWLFLGDFFEKGQSISLGLKKYTERELEQIGNSVMLRNDFLEKLKIKFYLAIAPNKQSVYDKYLPEGKYDPNNNTQLLKKYLISKFDFRLIDLKQSIDLRKDSTQLYYKTDTHWNGLGASIAFDQICDVIKKDFPDFLPYKTDDYFIKKNEPSRLDLTALLKLPILEEELIMQPKFAETGIRKNSRLSIPYNYTFDKNLYEFRFENHKKKLKILVFRDSFSTALLELFKENFGSSVIVWDFNFNKQLIADEKPDIVLYVVSERFTDIAFTK